MCEAAGSGILLGCECSPNSREAVFIVANDSKSCVLSDYFASLLGSDMSSVRGRGHW